MDLLSKTAKELRELRAGLKRDEVDPDQWDALTELIAEKVAEEAADARLNKDKVAQTEAQFRAKASKMWPGLKDKDSEFAKRVQEAFEARSDHAQNPQAYYDAANEVGIQLGYVPSGWKPAEETAAHLKIRGPGSADDNGPRTEGGLSREQLETLEHLAAEGLLEDSDDTRKAIASKFEEAADG